MNDRKQFTSGIISGELLEATHLVGKISFRAPSLDSRLSYTLYIPLTAYRNVHQHLQNSVGFNSDLARTRLRLIMNVHGTRRDASMFRDSLAPFADAQGVAILSPLCPAGLDGPLDPDSHHALRSKTLTAEIVALGIPKEVAHIWPGIDTDKNILSGLSDGAQLVHRFVYVYPERLQAAAIGAPGSATMLDDELQWPAGVTNTSDVFDGRAVDVAAITRISSISLYVGDGNTSSSWSEHLRIWMASNLPASRHDSKSGQRSRMDGVRALWEDWRAKGIAADLVVVRRVAHEYAKLVPTLENRQERQLVTDVTTS